MRFLRVVWAHLTGVQGFTNVLPEGIIQSVRRGGLSPARRFRGPLVS
jgi:hypothetical protein